VRDDTARFTSWPEMPDMTMHIAHIRRLARQGHLARSARTASGAERAQLTGAVFAIAAPLVFGRVTRGFETRRGHRACAIALHRMADECLDRFYDDTEAVVADVLAHAHDPIHNLEGWIVPRLRAATVNAHRIRRGQRGALQRPRLPGWLAMRLEGDEWLCQLALEILTWVGVDATSGIVIWPLDSWAERRGVITGDWTTSTPRTVEREVERVLAIMRTKPKWYADHVERPFGAKSTPVAPGPAAREVADEPPALALVEPHELADIRRTALATIALSAIGSGLLAEGDARNVVVSVISTVFGRLDWQRDIADAPHTASGDDESVLTLIDDPAAIERVVTEVLNILGYPGPGRP
jgi:hypothetical protein